MTVPVGFRKVVENTGSWYTDWRLDVAVAYKSGQDTEQVFEYLEVLVYFDRAQERVQVGLCWVPAVEPLRILGGLEWRMSWL